jgi:hypothetical protein
MNARRWDQIGAAGGIGYVAARTRVHQPARAADRPEQRTHGVVLD